ncbi:MAG: galactitol-1-phosphate 5-dehydrogenase [Acidobacteria bacterium]|nr:MAG: galactitol-1-phosphate 5-dehydrogenase [Acidobacteriota bacterium]
MKALVLKEYSRFSFEEVPEPSLAPDHVLIRVKACGICGSDVHGMDGSTGRRIPPIVMGHEASGVIAAAGPEVHDFKPGDRVTFDSTIYCGSCFFCKRGEINLCDNRRVLGVSCGDYRLHGAFAEYVAVPERVLYRIPDALSFERAAMIEPCSIAFHAVNRARLTINDTAVVVGSGMIGLLVIQALRLAGCGRIFAVDVEDAKLELARRLGADAVLNSSRVDTADEIRRLTHNRGADLAFEAVGISPAVQTALASVRKGGQLVLVGNLAPMVDFPLQAAVTRELTVLGCCASRGEYPACLDMIAAGKLDVDVLMSATAPLADGAAWFGRLYGKERGLMKVVLKPE